MAGFIINIFLFLGGTEIKSWTDVGLKTDEYINGLSLEVSNISTKTPVYYVSLIAINGAGLESSPVVSTPIVVVEADKAGKYIDGISLVSMSQIPLFSMLV